MKPTVVALSVPFLFICQTGCTVDSMMKSRWAMDDPVYAEKYQVGAERLDVPGKTKQALDARHIAGHHGYYVGGGYRDDPSAAAAEFGLFAHPSYWLSARAGLMGVVDSLDANSFGGVNLGVRVQTPSRIAPFVGLGVFSGVSRGVRDASNDGVDNDDDLFVDEPGEEEWLFDGWRTAVYPDVGLHAWVTPRTRLSGSFSYQITTEGRDHDYWLVGLSLSFLSKNSTGFADAYDSAW